jgi:hypothetical protein
LGKGVVGQHGQKLPSLGFVSERLVDTGVQAGVVIVDKIRRYRP